MNQDLEMLITEVKLSEDKEHLSLHTKSVKDCDCLWAQLAGQALDQTEGHQPILYNMPEEPPKSPVLVIEADTDQILLLLKYLENDLKDLAFLPKGTTESILEQIINSEKSSYGGGLSAKK